MNLKRLAGLAIFVLLFGLTSHSLTNSAFAINTNLITSPPTPMSSNGDVKPSDRQCSINVDPIAQVFQSPFKVVITFDSQASNISANSITNQIIESTLQNNILTVIVPKVDAVSGNDVVKIRINYDEPPANRDFQGVIVMHQVNFDYYSNNIWKENFQVSSSMTNTTHNVICIQEKIANDPAKYPKSLTYENKMSDLTLLNTYEPTGFQLDKNPNVCEMQPNPKDLSYARNDLIQETNNALLDWQSKLGVGNSKNSPWIFKIREIPLDQQYNSASYADCNVIFYYKPFFSQDNYLTSWAAGGITQYDQYRHKAFIEVFYNNFLPSTSIGMVIRHEFGHALGLGHFVVSSSEFSKVMTGAFEYPSIMFPNYSKNNNFNITPSDVKAVKEMYGLNGFTSSPLIKQGQFKEVPDFIKWDGLIAGGGDYIDENAFTNTMLPNFHTAKTMLDYLVFDNLIHVPKTYTIDDRNYTFPQPIIDNLVYPWVNNEISDFQFLTYLQHLIDNDQMGFNQLHNNTTPTTIYIH